MQTFVSEQYAIESWKMQLVFVQTCYVNLDSRYRKKCKQIQNGVNGAITMSKQIQNGQNFRPKNTSKYWLSMNTGADKSFMCVYDIQK